MQQKEKSMWWGRGGVEGEGAEEVFSSEICSMFMWLFWNEAPVPSWLEQGTKTLKLDKSAVKPGSCLLLTG